MISSRFQVKATVNANEYVQEVYKVAEPSVPEIPKELKESIPQMQVAVEQYRKSAKQYWNSGVIATFSAIENTPAYLSQGVNSLKEMAKGLE